MSEKKNERDNTEYKGAYDSARDGRFDLVETIVRSVIGESSIERAGREAGEADRAEYGSKNR